MNWNEMVLRKEKLALKFCIIREYVWVEVNKRIAM
jgi:hypothetical protein